MEKHKLTRAAIRTAAGLAAAAAMLVAATAMTGTAGVATALAGTAARAAAGPVPHGFQPASMTFVSANEGWVLGTAPCSHAPCTSVVRTTDGGKSWVGIPAPKFKLASFAGGPGLTRLRFADTSDGFAFGSELWVTHNGGKNWHRVTQVPGYILSLEASAGVVYAASQKSNHVTIYSTAAGKDAWRKVAGLPSAGGVAGLGTIALHGTAGWVIVGGRLYSTKNGSHWVRDSIKCAAHFILTSVAANSASQVTALCVGDAGLGSTTKVVYASSDGGTHFTKAGNAPRSGDGGVLAEPTPLHLFVATVSAASWLYTSTNGGKKWRNSLFLADAGKGWNDFGFTTASQGVAVEGTPHIGSRMYLTRNAGVTWKVVKF